MLPENKTNMMLNLLPNIKRIPHTNATKWHLHVQHAKAYLYGIEPQLINLEFTIHLAKLKIIQANSQN